MEVPKFNNRPNDHVVYQFYSEATGLKIQQDFWICRATAVDGVVFLITSDGMYVLITKRSDTMRDEPGKFCVPCGYLDFGETRYDAMVREVYEETSLYLPDYNRFIIFDNDKQPFLTKDEPTNKRQNISNIYLTVLDFHGKMTQFPLDIINFTCNETSMVKLVKLMDFYNTCNDYEWAFSHDEAIKSAVKYFNQHFERL